jgi:hypothetical protein
MFFSHRRIYFYLLYAGCQYISTYFVFFPAAPAAFSGSKRKKVDFSGKRAYTEQVVNRLIINQFNINRLINKKTVQRKKGNSELSG